VTTKSKPYYWIECDWPGCGESAQQGDFSAWADAGAAEDEAINSDWTRGTIDDEFFCLDHLAIDQGDLDEGAPDVPYLLIDDEGEATYVEVSA
jgi:hypothetical protein